MYWIENVLEVNLQEHVLFGLGVSIRQRNTCEANSALFLVPTRFVDFRIVLEIIQSMTWYLAHFADNRRKVLPTALVRCPPSGFF